jgi:hypothetical protein
MTMMIRIFMPVSCKVYNQSVVLLNRVSLLLQVRNCGYLHCDPGNFVVL